MNLFDQKIAQAVTILKRGGVVALPTETVYGLAADARNPEAIKKIFQVKQRPSDHPLIVHIANAHDLSAWASEIPEPALVLVKAFWPGPLTLILKKAPQVSALLTGGQDTIALRIPNHPLTLAVLQKFGGGLAMPSANRFGRISPTSAEDVSEELDDAVDLILDGGTCALGVESTILDLTQDPPVILRPGLLSASDIEKVLGKSLGIKKTTAPRVSGSHISHYAPQTQTLLIAAEALEKFLKTINKFPVAVISRHSTTHKNPQIHWVTMPNDVHAYAHDFYHCLRELDRQHFQQIIVEAVPETAEWDAVRDRVQRACA